MVDFKAAACFLSNDILRIAKIVAPDGRVIGDEYDALCPIRDDKNFGSFRINIKTGAWADFANNVAGHDIISYVKYSLGLSRMSDAIEKIENILGFKLQNLSRQNNGKKYFSSPPGAHPALGIPTNKFVYKSINGEELAIVMRFELEDGKKTFSILRHCDLGWYWGGYKRDEPRPLYGLEKINSNRPIIIVEGEKKADKLQEVLPEYTVLSICGGHGQYKKSDLSPIIGTKPIIWPDNDKPGFEVAAYISKKTGGRIIQPPNDKPPGWDCYDAITEGLDIRQIINYELPSDQVVPIGYYDDSKCMFWSRAARQNIIVKSVDISKHLETLCPLPGYWAQQYAQYTMDDGRINRQEIARELILACYNTGRNLTNIQKRNVGIYIDENRIVANCGGKLIVDGVEVEPYKIKSKYLYETPQYYINPESDIKFDDFYEPLSETRLQSEIDIRLLMGTIFCGYLSGCLKWRSHLWITAEPGSGKSALVDYFIKPAIEPIHGEALSGNLTEAAIRQIIGAKSTIFSYDEAEYSSFMQKILDYIRLSSSGADMARGTSGGKEAIRYHCQSTFIVTSIGKSDERVADQQRILQAQMINKENDWETIREKLIRDCTPAAFAAVMKRAEKLAKICMKSIDKYINVFIEKMTNCPNKNAIRRYADLTSVPFSGFWHWQHDCEISETYIEECIKLCQERGLLTPLTDDVSKTTTAHDSWNKFLSYPLQTPSGKRSIAQLIIASCTSEFNGTITINDSCAENDLLKAHGIYIKSTGNQSTISLFLPHNNMTIREIFEKTGYPDYKTILGRHPDCEDKSKPGRGHLPQIVRGVSMIVNIAQLTAKD